MNERTGKEIRMAWASIIAQETELINNHINNPESVPDYKTQHEALRQERLKQEEAFFAWQAGVIELCQDFTVSEVKRTLLDKVI